MIEDAERRGGNVRIGLPGKGQEKWLFPFWNIPLKKEVVMLNRKPNVKEIILYQPSAVCKAVEFIVTGFNDRYPEIMFIQNDKQQTSAIWKDNRFFSFI